MKKIVIACLLLYVAASIYSEASLGVDLNFVNTLYWGADNDWYYIANGSAGLVLKSTGNREVKGELVVNFQPNDANLPLFILKKASVKVRFDRVLLTVGKTRIGWGDGVVFNSGDVIFSSLNPNVDLTQDEARNDTAWLVMARYSTGQVTFFEAILLPAAMQSDYSFGNIYHTSGGLRFVTELGNQLIEVGYIYKGESKVAGDSLGHLPYISTHGAIVDVDWYLSSSIAIPYEDANWDDLSQSWNFSAGLYYQFEPWYGANLTLRLEGLLFPWQRWEEYSDRLSTVSSGKDKYGLYLHPQISLSINQKSNIYLMGIYSPVDGSARITAGASFTMFQGFSITGYTIFGLGDSNDMFAWKRGSDALPIDTMNGFTAMIGVRYKY